MCVCDCNPGMNSFPWGAFFPPIFFVIFLSLSVPLYDVSPPCPSNPVGQSHSGPPQLGGINGGHTHTRNKAEHLALARRDCVRLLALFWSVSFISLLLFSSQTNVKEIKQSTAKSYSSLLSYKHLQPLSTQTSEPDTALLMKIMPKGRSHQGR